MSYEQTEASTHPTAPLTGGHEGSPMPNFHEQTHLHGGSSHPHEDASLGGAPPPLPPPTIEDMPSPIVPGPYYDSSALSTSYSRHDDDRPHGDVGDPGALYGHPPEEAGGRTSAIGNGEDPSHGEDHPPHYHYAHPSRAPYPPPPRDYGEHYYSHHPGAPPLPPPPHRAHSTHAPLQASSSGEDRGLYTRAGNSSYERDHPYPPAPSLEQARARHEGPAAASAEAEAEHGGYYRGGPPPGSRPPPPGPYGARYEHDRRMTGPPPPGYRHPLESESASFDREDPYPHPRAPPLPPSSSARHPRGPPPPHSRWMHPHEEPPYHHYPEYPPPYHHAPPPPRGRMPPPPHPYRRPPVSPPSVGTGSGLDRRAPPPHLRSRPIAPPPHHPSYPPPPGYYSGHPAYSRDENDWYQPHVPPSHSAPPHHAGKYGQHFQGAHVSSSMSMDKGNQHGREGRIIPSDHDSSTDKHNSSGLDALGDAAANATNPNRSHSNNSSSNNNYTNGNKPHNTNPFKFDSTEAPSIICTCKKSKCLKLYCQCFSSMTLCNALCRCHACCNTLVNDAARKVAMRTILARNPGAFQTKFIGGDDGDAAIHPGVHTATESGGVPKQSRMQHPSPTTSAANAPATHKLGCKCRKSACLKKYCECYNANARCGPNCRCVGCKNLPEGISYSRPPAVGLVGGKGGETRNSAHLLDAAQNLAFLKHAGASASTNSPESQPESFQRTVTAESPFKQTDGRESAPKSSPTFNEDSPSGQAVNTLLMAAYAMTELDDDQKKAAGDESKNSSADTSKDVKEVESGTQAKEVSPSSATETESPHPEFTLKTPSRTPLPIDDSKTKENNANIRNENTPAKQSSQDGNSHAQSPSNGQNQTAEVSPDNTERRSNRKRSISSMEAESINNSDDATAITSPPKARRKPSEEEAPTESTSSKMELFRKDNGLKSSSSEDYPRPERNVSADSDDPEAGKNCDVI